RIVPSPPSTITRLGFDSAMASPAACVEAPASWPRASIQRDMSSKTACQSGLVGLATRKARRREVALAVTKALRGRSTRIITVRGKMGDAGCGGTTDEDCWQPGILGADLAVLTLHARSLHNCCGAIWVTESDRADTTWFAIGSVSHGPLASEYACQCHPE